MKKLFLPPLILLLSSVSASAQATSAIIKPNQSFTLVAGQKATITSLRLYSQAVEYGTCVYDFPNMSQTATLVRVKVGNLTVGGVQVDVDDPGMVIVGPATLSLTSVAWPANQSVDTDDSDNILAVKLKTNSSETAYVSLLVEPAPVANAIPANAVVVPASQTGPVQIQLESSVDLIQWSPVEPGFFDPAASNRFFRVRALNQ